LKSWRPGDSVAFGHEVTKARRRPVLVQEPISSSRLRVFVVAF
jgi:hypothetical protein